MTGVPSNTTLYGRPSGARPRNRLSVIQELTHMETFGIVSIIAFRGMEHEGTSKKATINRPSLFDTGGSGQSSAIYPLLHIPCPKDVFGPQGGNSKPEPRFFR